MTITTIHPMFDGPISLDAVRTERASKVGRMAHVLLDNRCYADHGDSIMVLVASGRFSTFDIMACIDDARQVATQYAVEMEMAWS
jgi:hypothetical protein